MIRYCEDFIGCRFAIENNHWCYDDIYKRRYCFVFKTYKNLTLSEFTIKMLKAIEKVEK